MLDTQHACLQQQKKMAIYFQDQTYTRIQDQQKQQDWLPAQHHPPPSSTTEDFVSEIA
jgi:hypothetical protein